MHTRSAWVSGLLLLLVCLFVSSHRATAEEWHIGGGSGANSFATLEDFRIAIAGGLIMNDGDSILLYKDDSSLTDNLNLPDGWNITFRSVGGMHTVSSDTTSITGPNSILYILGNSPKLTLDGVRIAGNNKHYYSGLEVTSQNNDGRLTVSNSVISDSQQGIGYTGGGEINITNTTFTNNWGANAIAIINALGEQTNLNITINGSANRKTIWQGRSNTSIDVMADGDMHVNFDIAAGKILDIRDMIRVGQTQQGIVTLEKNGAGELKLAGGDVRTDWFTGDYMGSMNFTANAGKVHFTARRPGVTLWDAGTYGTMTFKAGSTFKPHVTPGNLAEVIQNPDEVWSGVSQSFFTLGQFRAEEGVRLEIGGISQFPQINIKDDRYTYDGILYMSLMYLGAGNALNSTLPSSMKISNNLLDAELKFGELGGAWDEAEDTDWDGIFIKVNKLKNLSTLEGVGEYADIYRRLSTLTEDERDLLDTIYATGGVNDLSRPYMQSLSGAIVTNSLLTMRHNWANMLRKINRRATDFQHEELMEKVEEMTISGEGYASYCQPSYNPVTDYIDLWAAVDTSWMYQNDLDSLAGYRLNTSGINIGVDRHIDNYILGGVVRYDNGTMKLKSNKATRTESESVMASLYASWAQEGIYVTGGLHAAYGWNQSWSNYRTPFASMTSKTDNYSTTLYGAHTEMGYMWETQMSDLPLRITPYGGLGYAKMHRQATTEHGGGNLDRHFRRGDWDLWEMSAGLRFALPINRGGYIVTPNLDVAWSRTLGDSRNTHGDVNLLADPAGLWRNSVMGKNRSALRASAGVNAHFYRNMDVGANYDFEWRDSFWSHQLNLNFSVGF